MNWYRQYIKAQTEEAIKEKEDTFDFFKDIPAQKPSEVSNPETPEVENWLQKYRVNNPNSPSDVSDYIEDNNITGLENIKKFFNENRINFEEVKLKDNSIILVVYFTASKEQSRYRKHNSYVIDDFTYPELKGASEWLNAIYDHSLSNYVEIDDWNKIFWNETDDHSKLYHATDPKNVASIKKKGLLIDNKTRGLTNKWTGSAVFTSENPDEVSSYGNALFEIDIGAMKKDGYMPTVNKEEPIEEYKMREKLANLIGIEDFNALSDVSSDGIWETTWVIFGNIPPKYLKQVSDNETSEM